MTADTITAIKKALEGAEQFIVNGVELGYIRMPDPETPDSAHQTLPMIRQAQATLESLQRENERLRNLADRLKLEAQGHAMEARGANSTIAEIYQIISGARGEPGSWNGAEPVRKYVDAIESEVKRLTRDRYDLAYVITGGEDAPGLLNSVPTSDLVDIARNTHRCHSADIDRAMNADAQMKLLRNKVAARALTDAQLAEEIEAIDVSCTAALERSEG